MVIVCIYPILDEQLGLFKYLGPNIYGKLARAKDLVFASKIKS